MNKHLFQAIKILIHGQMKFHLNYLYLIQVEINFRQSQIKSIKFNTFKKLILRDNSFDTLETPLNLSQLFYLDLSYNYIRKMPFSLIRLNSLHHLNLSSNLIDELPRQLFDFQLIFLGIAFIMIPQEIYKVIKKLEQLELDQLNYCNFSYYLDEQSCNKLMVVFGRDCTFQQFYEHFMISQLVVTMKNLIFVVSQSGIKENTKFINYLIDLLNQKDSELLNVIYILSARTIQTFIIQILYNYRIDLYYSIKFDFIWNHNILILKGQTPYTTLLQHSHNIDAIMEFWVQKDLIRKLNIKVKTFYIQLLNKIYMKEQNGHQNIVMSIKVMPFIKILLCMYLFSKITIS